MAARKKRDDFALWEKQMAQRKATWNAELFDRAHERLMREAIAADIDAEAGK